MKTISRIFALAAMLGMTGVASAQSLKAANPAPLQAGVNSGTVDNFIGTQYWYFIAHPGKVEVTVRFKAMTLLGNAQKTALTITMYNSSQTWHTTKVLSSTDADAVATFTGTLKDTEKVIVSVEPPSGGLVRAGGDYQITVSGAVSYGTAHTNGDPVVGTYSSYYGATKFQADGTIVCADGTTGTWKLFDAQNHIYSINIANLQYSEQLVPGRGLVDTADQTYVRFQAMH
jgi:hypothetical protein